MKYDYIIQIIGAPKSGKSAVAHMIEEILERNDIGVINCDTNDPNDFRHLKRGKLALVTTFRAQNDPEINTTEK